jgi:hypothetical protein
VDFYVYVHLRSDSGEVFYVGKGKGRRAEATHNRNPWWKNVVSKSGGFKTEKIAWYDEESKAFEHERCAIACFRAAGIPLANLSDGGEGPSGWKRPPFSVEHRARISSSRRLRVIRPETGAKISAAHTGKKRGPLSEETKARISAAQKGRPGRPHTEEAKAKISASKIGKPRSARGLFTKELD